MVYGVGYRHWRYCFVFCHLLYRFPEEKTKTLILAYTRRFCLKRERALSLRSPIPFAPAKRESALFVVNKMLGNNDYIKRRRSRYFFPIKVVINPKPTVFCS